MELDCLKNCWAACCYRTTLSDLTIEQVWFYRRASRKTGRSIIITPAQSEGLFDIMFEEACPLLEGIKCGGKNNPLRAEDCNRMQPGDLNCSDSRNKNPKS